MSDREQELNEVPLRPADKSRWPEGIRSISWAETDALGVDAKGELYWHGKPVEIRRPLDLTWRQKLVAGIVAVATVFAAFGAVAQGSAAYNEWACKVGWKAAACPTTVTGAGRIPTVMNSFGSKANSAFYGSERDLPSQTDRGPDAFGFGGGPPQPASWSPRYYRVRRRVRGPRDRTYRGYQVRKNSWLQLQGRQGICLISRLLTNVPAL